MFMSFPLEGFRQMTAALWVIVGVYGFIYIAATILALWPWP